LAFAGLAFKISFPPEAITEFEVSLLAVEKSAKFGQKSPKNGKKTCDFGSKQAKN
jgi:hypothetical protein